MTKISTQFEQNFDYFEAEYPTTESRHERALQLALNEEDPPGTASQYRSRLTLASLWGEERGRLREVAFRIYAVKLGAMVNVEEPVIILREGTIEDIHAEDEDRRLSSDVQIDFGIVDVNELKQGFAGNNTEHGGARQKVKPPYLGLGTRIPMRSWHRITVDVLGIPKVETKDEEVTLAPFLWATVPLRFDLDTYHAQRQIEERPVFMGPAANAIMASLASKTSDGALDGMAELAHSA